MVQNRVRIDWECVLCQNDSSEKLWCLFDSVQKSQIHAIIHCALAYRVLLNIADWMPWKHQNWHLELRANGHNM